MEKIQKHGDVKQIEASSPRISALTLFLTFSQITVSGFGGLMFWARYVLIERRRWLTDREFLDLQVFAQLLPGPNVLNLTVMAGYRFGGWSGAAAAVAGFLACPFLVVIGMGVLYQYYGTLVLVQRALAGMSIVAAALLLGVDIKLAKALPPDWRTCLFGVLAFIGVGIFRWPLPLVLAALAPCAIAAAWRETE